MVLAQDEGYAHARSDFSKVLLELREVLGSERVELLLRVEERAHALSAAASDVAFGLALTVTTSELGGGKHAGKAR